MLPTLAVLVVSSLSPVRELPTAVWQVAPSVTGAKAEIRKTQPRAVLLVPGLLLHPLRPDKATRPEMHDWMHPSSALVQNVGRDADVFAFGYAQTLPVDAVSLSDGFRTAVEKLKAAGYTDIVLVGHSAGGIVARQFAERFPKAGVTKVIQVGSPNQGSPLAMIGVGVPKPQEPFVRSLAPKPRLECACPPLGDDVQVCCVVCKVPKLAGDTMVGMDSQWPDDLRKLGVPAVLVGATHFDAMKAPHAVTTIGELVRGKIVRWTPEQVEQGRGIMFGKEADAAAVRAEGKFRRR